MEGVEMAKMNNQHVDGVYVLRLSLSGTDGWYVGVAETSQVWGRLNKHGRNSGCWKEAAKIGHNISGVEAVFTRVGEHDPDTFSSLSQIESLIAAALIDRYGVERVYGGTYSHKTTPNYNSFSATPEFVSGVENTNWEWLLDYNLNQWPDIDSPLSKGPKNHEREWRVLSSPPLPC